MSKITIDKLEPNKKVAKVEFSDENNMRPTYYDDDGKRIAVVEEEVDYKPSYDFETESINHWWYRTKSSLYRDVHHEVRVFRSRTTIGKYLKALIWIQLDKRLLRFL